MFYKSRLLHWPLKIFKNFFLPRNIVKNLKNPIPETIHTSHKQHSIGRGNYIVEHYLFDKLVTTDLIKKDPFKDNLLDVIKQVFKKDFYYGHAEYFPKPFVLIKREYINQDFNKEAFLNLVKGIKS